MRMILEKIFFGNEAGDDADIDDLTSYFVEQSMFRDFVEPKEKVLVATAKKGVGKSALIQWLAYKLALTDPDALVVKCRGADLTRAMFKMTTEVQTPADHIRDWMVRICALVNRHLARTINLAVTDDQITMVETAELDGFKSRNLVSSLVDRFTGALEKFHPTKLEAKNEVELLRRMKNRKLWILIDDLDATFQNTPEECLELSTFFSACRYLAQDMKDVCFRVTMRTDVWPIVRRYDESLDKMEQYVRDIVWEQSDFLKLLSKRVQGQLTRLGITPSKAPDYVQEEERDEYLLGMIFVHKMPWGDQDAYTYRVIYTVSYHRPRWAIQLCKLAQKFALKSDDELISKDHIDAVWGEYGKKRIADLVSEHKHQCQQIEELVNGFRGCERRMTREGLFVWIKNHITNHASIVIEGRNATSPMQVAQFLYRIGFIVARSERNDKTYEHYSFSDMPDFLTSRTNDDFGVAWEIHPCYRQALDIEKVNRSQRIKMGMKPVPKRARKAVATKSLLKPIVAEFAPPVQLSKKESDRAGFVSVTTLVKCSGKKRHEIISALMEQNVFVSANGSVEPAVAERVALRYGFELEAGD